MHVQTNTKEHNRIFMISYSNISKIVEYKFSEVTIIRKHMEFYVTHYEMYIKIFPWLMENKQFNEFKLESQIIAEGS